MSGASASMEAAGLAELYVAAFVSGGDGEKSSLAPYLGASNADDLRELPVGEWFAAHVTTTAVERISARRWAVTVAADLLRRGGDDSPPSFVAVGVRWFRVELVDADGGLVAATLPSIVAGPPVPEPVEDEWPPARVLRADDPLDDAVQRFLVALLTGNGELGRYAAPGSQLRAAPTFDDVQVDELTVRGSGDGRRVRVWLTGSSAGASMRLVYDLSLARREGRWEVAGVGSPAAPDAALQAASADRSTDSKGS